MSKFINEFKEFAVKGNAVDMAVGVIIGGAFGKIVSSLVNDIIMPPIGWLIGGVNFSDLKVTLPTMDLGIEQLEPATINYGNFIQTTFDFVIIALCIFMIVKGINHLDTQKGRRAGKASHSASTLCRRETAYRNPRLAQGQEIDTNPPTGIDGSCTDGSAIYL